MATDTDPLASMYRRIKELEDNKPSGIFQHGHHDSWEPTILGACVTIQEMADELGYDLDTSYGMDVEQEWVNKHLALYKESLQGLDMDALLQKVYDFRYGISHKYLTIKKHLVLSEAIQKLLDKFLGE